jgi:hypothetical protein
MIAPPLAPIAPPLNTLCWVYDMPEHPRDNQKATTIGATAFRIFSPSNGWIIKTALLRLIMEGQRQEIHGQNNHFHMVQGTKRHPLNYELFRLIYFPAS